MSKQPAAYNLGRVLVWLAAGGVVLTALACAGLGFAYLAGAL
jgi:hypothetical protein